MRSFPRRNFSICLSGCCYFLFPNWLKVFVCSLSLNRLRLMPLKCFIASLLRISGPRSSVCLGTYSFQVRSSMDTRPLLPPFPVPRTAAVIRCTWLKYSLQLQQLFLPPQGALAPFSLFSWRSTPGNLWQP